MFVTQKQVKNKIVISSLLDRFYKMTHNIVVPAMCDSEEPKWHEQIGDARSSLSGFNGITLIYAGNPARKDLVHSVINSVQRLADENRPIRFIVLGVNRDNYLLHYSSLLHSTDLHKNIVFLGRVSQDMIPSFYHQADFMVLLREQTRKSNAGFPTKFAEAMTSGIPVIANLTSDLGHYLIDGQTGIVVSESSEEAIYNTLNEKVLPLSQERISQLKQNVHQVSKQLDYRYYVNALNKYMSELD